MAERGRSLHDQLCFGRIIVIASFLLTLFSLSNASEGDRDTIYRSCVQRCVGSGCVGNSCFVECSDPIPMPINGEAAGVGHVGAAKELLHHVWRTLWDCSSECKYQCMLHREEERKSFGLQPVKYHGKWPFQRILGLQEAASVVFSLLNLLSHVLGLWSFLLLVYYKLPLRQSGNGGPYYEFSSLWVLYAFFAINSWFWSAIFHARDINLTERLDYCSAVAFLGSSLALAIIRTGNLRVEAARVMISAPIIAFVCTHILYLNFYDFDYGLNMKVCVVMAVLQMLIWSLWASFTRHPARLKLWITVLGGSVSMLLELYDFPPYKGVLDAHCLWHAATIPLSYLWWSFIRDDASYRTLDVVNRGRITKKAE